MKIADVGISKKVEDVTGTLAGTPIYIAPEVFASEVYDWRADIYSFGLILWEMWHGERVFSELGLVSCLEFSSKIREGYRPTPQKYSMPPPPVWQELMTECWETSPENRVTACKCKEELTELLKCFNV